MASTIANLTERGLIKPPKWVADSSVMEVVTGSLAYGTAQDASDFDVVGVCIPPKGLVFPHVNGEIEGFGEQKKRFDQYQEHHVFDKDAMNGLGREYDLTSFSIVRYFTLCMDCNPNMIDTLFAPVDCLLHQTKIGQMVREGRHLFLSKRAWHRYKGYAYSQMTKIRSKNPQPGSKRAALQDSYGYDVKFAAHCIRLLDYAEQVMVNQDLDLRRCADQLKAIRRGEVAEEAIYLIFAEREAYLERVYTESTLRHSPDETAIKNLLLACLEEHFGRLDNLLKIEQTDAEVVLGQIAALVKGYGRRA